MGVFKAVNLENLAESTGLKCRIKKCLKKVAPISIYYAEPIAKKTALAFFG